MHLWIKYNIYIYFVILHVNTSRLLYFHVSNWQYGIWYAVFVVIYGCVPLEGAVRSQIAMCNSWMSWRCEWDLRQTLSARRDSCSCYYNQLILISGSQWLINLLNPAEWVDSRFTGFNVVFYGHWGTRITRWCFFYQKWHIMLQNIYISNKCCSEFKWVHKL